MPNSRPPIRIWRTVSIRNPSAMLRYHHAKKRGRGERVRIGGSDVSVFARYLALGAFCRVIFRGRLRPPWDHSPVNSVLASFSEPEYFPPTSFTT